MEIENIQRYIAEANIPAALREKQSIMSSELLALLQGDDRVDMIALAFNFGFAKCYRAAGQLGEEVAGTNTAAINQDKHLSAAQKSAGLASPRQIRFLEARGFQHVETWSFGEAKSTIDRIAANGWRVPRGIIPAEYLPQGKEAQA